MWLAPAGRCSVKVRARGERGRRGRRGERGAKWKCMQYGSAAAYRRTAEQARCCKSAVSVQPCSSKGSVFVPLRPPACTHARTHLRPAVRQAAQRFQDFCFRSGAH